MDQQACSGQFLSWMSLRCQKILLTFISPFTFMLSFALSSVIVSKCQNWPNNSTKYQEQMETLYFRAVFFFLAHVAGGRVVGFKVGIVILVSGFFWL